jgi:hypothetical protein
MRIIIEENYEDMSRTAASIVKDYVSNHPACVLGCATGTTPIGMYQGLVEAHREGKLDFSENPFLQSGRVLRARSVQRSELYVFYEGTPVRPHQRPPGAHPSARRHGRRYRSRLQALRCRDRTQRRDRPAGRRHRYQRTHRFSTNRATAFIPIRIKLPCTKVRFAPMRAFSLP